jgi:septal ring factor EnvC (AmiA/AmiB activator)
MKHFWLLTLNALVAVSFLSASGSLHAQSDSNQEVSEEALETIIAAIENVREELSQRGSERTIVYEEIQGTEKTLASIITEISQTESAISDNETQMVGLVDEENSLLTLKSSQQDLIKQYLRSAYQTGKQEYFKLLLNQENPSQSSRSLRYYQYFNNARGDKVEEFNSTLAELNTVEESIVAVSLTLEEEHSRLGQQQSSLQDSISNRQTLLDNLDVLLVNNNSKLEALETERAEMELLLEELRLSIANISLGSDQQDFATMKGLLPWPVAGRLSNNWGSSYGLGDLNWEGVTVDAREGSEVRAIHHGRVVFSDWFSSSGLLLIIDHGDGYMSLYAQNQALFKEVGEWVNSGETIATVGNTGGKEEYGLYFEIRHNGESEDPSAWCSTLTQADARQ